MNFDFITSEGTKCNITEKTLLIFIDETGHEQLNDPYYPYWGFGGCVIPAQIYLSNISTPWSKIKDQYFNIANKPFHAADLKNPSQVQIEVLNKFFNTFSFGRFATIISDKTVINVEANLFDIAAATLYARLEKIVANTLCTDILMIFESSQRTDKIIAHFFSNYKFEETINGTKQAIPIERYRMSKSDIEPGLEVADFIIHSAGTTIRDVQKGKLSKPLERKDFECIFKNVDERLSSFMFIKEIARKHK